MGCYPATHMTAESKQLGIRCTFEEESCIREAAAALDVDVSTLLEVAMAQQCVDLGMALGDDTPPRLRPGFSWLFAPARGDGDSAKTRLTGYAGPLLYPTFESAAYALHVSVPLFAIGSTLRHIAILQAANAERRGEKTHNAALAKVGVPYGFDELVRQR